MMNNVPADFATVFLLFFAAMVMIVIICSWTYTGYRFKEAFEEREMASLIILVDMDDTIDDLLTAWVSTLNQRHNLNVDRDKVGDWDMCKSFPELTKEQVFAPLQNDVFWETVKPIQGAVEVLQKLIADGHRVYIVTSSSYETLKTKIEVVLFRYFPFIKWEDVIVTSCKQLICGDILVDDAVHNLEGGAYYKILMDAPHNRDYDAEGNGMDRVKNWMGAYDIITQKAILSYLYGKEVTLK